MPALSFKRQFADLVESGQKRQTIRARRQDGRDPKPGDKLFLFFGLRTKGCRRLGEAVCINTAAVLIDRYRIVLGASEMTPAGEEALARADGFETAADLRRWFEAEHGLPFWGLLIQW